MKRVIYPGTFDPPTNAHIHLVERALKLFNQVIIAVGVHPQKTTLFSVAERLRMLEAVFQNDSCVVVKEMKGLLVDFARQEQVTVILRGVRTLSDFDYEMQLAGMNRQLAAEIETVFLTPIEKYSALSSTLVRELIVLKGDPSFFVHPVVLSQIQRLQKI